MVRGREGDAEADGVHVVVARLIWPCAAWRDMGAGASAETWRWTRTKRQPKYVDVEDDYIRPAAHVVLGQVSSARC